MSSCDPRCLGAAAVLLAGCHSVPLPGVFPDGPGGDFYAARGHYRVRALTGGRLMPEHQWRFHSFAHGDDGWPREPSQADRFWTFLRSSDNSGQRAQVVRHELFDLQFVHRTDGTQIWVRTVPLDRAFELRDLDVMARDYVDRTSGGSVVSVSLVGGRASVREQRFAPRMVTEGPAEVAGLHAYHVSFELIDLDREEVEPGSGRGDRFTLVFVRPGPHVWYSGVTGGRSHPMVLMFGMTSRPEHHDAHRDAFADLIGRVDVRPEPLF